MTRRTAVALGLVIAAAVLAVLATRRRHSTAPPHDTSPVSTAAALRVPHAAPGGFVLDGKLTDPGWKSDAWVGHFKTAGGERALPDSEARITWDERFLYLGLYAADEDIRSTEHFDVSVTGPNGAVKTFTFFANGPGADADGTLDDPSDEDEEWGVEAAVPLAELGAREGDRVALTLGRCDTPKASPPGCGRWSGDIVLAPRIP